MYDENRTNYLFKVISRPAEWKIIFRKYYYYIWTNPGYLCFVGILALQLRHYSSEIFINLIKNSYWRYRLWKYVPPNESRKLYLCRAFRAPRLLIPIGICTRQNGARPCLPDFQKGLSRPALSRFEDIKKDNRFELLNFWTLSPSYLHERDPIHSSPPFPIWTDFARKVIGAWALSWFYTENTESMNKIMWLAEIRESNSWLSIRPSILA